MSWFGRASCDDVDPASCFANLHRLDDAAGTDGRLTSMKAETTIERYSYAQQLRTARTFEPRHVPGIALAS